MPLVFSYGSLQSESVQVSTYGRRLRGEPDALPQYALTQIAIEDPRRAAELGKTHHVNAARTGHADDTVTGTAFELSDEELGRTDEYERQDAYSRISVTLASGREAWVYVADRH